VIFFWADLMGRVQGRRFQDEGEDPWVYCSGDSSETTGEVETQLKARETFALLVGRALEKPKQLRRPRVGGWSREARELRPSPGGRGGGPFEEKDPQLSVPLST
jgi:hypothetical protein